MTSFWIRLTAPTFRIRLRVLTRSGRDAARLSLLHFSRLFNVTVRKPPLWTLRVLQSITDEEIVYIDRLLFTVYLRYNIIEYKTFQAISGFMSLEEI